MSVVRKITSFIRSLKKSQTILVPIPQAVEVERCLEGRCALITGGSSGIGFAIATTFIKAGCNVIICGSSKEKLLKACEAINSRNVAALQFDVKNVGQIKSKIDEATQFFSQVKIDILVNSAGLTQTGNIWDVTEEIYDNIMDVNVKGTFFMSKYMAEYWISEGIKGNILNISSSSALKPAWGPYQMSKWAIKGFTIGLAQELTPKGIVVNALAPGKTATPMMVKGGDISDLCCDGQPIGRYESPQELANVALFLVGDMGRVVLGDTIYATGGTGLF